VSVTPIMEGFVILKKKEEEDAAPTTGKAKQ
jgi:hypothetical protein